MSLVWVGPNHCMDPAEAKRRGLKVYEQNPAPQTPPRRKTVPVTPPKPAAPARPPVPKPIGKSLPKPPLQSPDHPLRMERREVQDEFDALYAWVKAADDAPGKFTVRQEIERDMIAERVDLLRNYAFG